MSISMLTPPNTQTPTGILLRDAGRVEGAVMGWEEGSRLQHERHEGANAGGRPLALIRSS
jgi:hypothetical protein